MGNLQYHKGSFCVYKSIFCQEGYCADCEIYLRRPADTKTTDHYDGLKNVRKLEEAGSREIKH